MELTLGLKQSRALFSSAPKAVTPHSQKCFGFLSFLLGNALPRGTVSSAPALTYDGKGADPAVCDQNELSFPNETALPASPSFSVLPPWLFKRYRTFILKMLFIDTYDCFYKGSQEGYISQFPIKMIPLQTHCSVFLFFESSSPLSTLMWLVPWSFECASLSLCHIAECQVTFKVIQNFFYYRSPHMDQVPLQKRALRLQPALLEGRCIPQALVVTVTLSPEHSWDIDVPCVLLLAADTSPNAGS